MQCVGQGTNSRQSAGLSVYSCNPPGEPPVSLPVGTLFSLQLLFFHYLFQLRERRDPMDGLGKLTVNDGIRLRPASHSGGLRGDLLILVVSKVCRATLKRICTE